MHIDSDCTRVRLDPRRPQRLTGARGARLIGVSGTTWVTIDNDPRDLVLGPGSEVELASGELVILLGLGGPAWVELRRAPAAMARPPAWAVLLRAVRAWWPTPRPASSAAAR